MTNEKKTFRPSNEIDLQVMTTIPHISSDEVSDSLKSKFKVYAKTDKGDYVEIKDYWGVMNTFVSDLRLGNLDKTELFYVRYILDLYGDTTTLMPDEFNRASILLLERVFSVTETSQSKQGFLRRLFNTIFQHQSVKDESPNKRSWFGFGGSKDKGNNNL